MMLKKLVIYLMAPVFSLSMIFNYSAHAESYIGGSIGVAFSSDAENIKLSSGALTGTLTDLDTDSSFAYGFKTGHYFESIPWFGVEFNFSQSDPDISKQTGTATGTIGVFTAAATGQGSIDVDHVNTYGFLAMFRATEEQAKDMFNIQPYLGLGVGINQVSLGTGRVFSAAGVESDSVDLGADTDVGFLLSAGLNYDITDHIKAYSEYKYTSGEFEATTADVKYALDYDASSLMFGAAYSF
jgi:opacity protein-like surface antigen